MGYLCEFCGEQRAIVHCRSDNACLCLSCDRNVHSANSLSKRHPRTLLCESCNSQPAFVRCEEEKVSLCQNCNWTSHQTSTSTSSHKRQPIHSYSGCPSSSELSSIWSFLLDSSSAGESKCGEHEENGSMSFNSVGEILFALDGENGARSVDKSSGPVSTPLDPPNGAGKISMPKLSCLGARGPSTSTCEDDIQYGDFNMDEMDLDLENYEELFGNGGMDSLFGIKDSFVAFSSCRNVVEGLSAGLVKGVKPTCSNALSTDSMMSGKTETVLSFTPRSNLLFSGINDDTTSVADYQDCEASPQMFLMGEPPWCPPCIEISSLSGTRSDAVLRYMEKKKNRRFDKTVRYASRKARADVRKREKGRFIKAGDSYDYDPLIPTRSF